MPDAATPMNRADEMFEVVLEIPRNMEGAAGIIQDGVKALLHANRPDRDREFPQIVVHEDTTVFRLKVRDESVVAGRMEEMQSEIERLEGEVKRATCEALNARLENERVVTLHNEGKQHISNLLKPAEALSKIIRLVAPHMSGPMTPHGERHFINAAQTDPQLVVEVIRTYVDKAAAYSDQTAEAEVKAAAEERAARPGPAPSWAPSPECPYIGSRPVFERELLIALETGPLVSEALARLCPVARELGLERALDLTNTLLRKAEADGLVSAVNRSWTITFKGLIVLALQDLRATEESPAPFNLLLQSKWLHNVSRSKVRSSLGLGTLWKSTGGSFDDGLWYLK